MQERYVEGVYTLSRKTENRLSENQKEILYALIDDMNKSESRRVERTIWKFIHSPLNAMTANGFFGCNLDKKQIEVICKEIIKHYQKSNPDWDFGAKQNEIPYKDMITVDKLKAELQEKGTVFMQVIMHIVLNKVESYLNKNCEYSFEIERAIYLLQSDGERMKFGGFLELGFRYYEAEFLKPYAKFVGEILRELYTNI